MPKVLVHVIAEGEDIAISLRKGELFRFIPVIQKLYRTLVSEF